MMYFCNTFSKLYLWSNLIVKVIMNRKTAISRLFILGTGVLGVYGAYKAYDLLKSPDFNKLYLFQGLIDELAETVIPKEIFPGAKDGDVGFFITKMIVNCTERKSQNNFIKGLEDLRYFTLEKYNTSFENCTNLQKEEILLYFQNEGNRKKGKFGKVQNYLYGKSFFDILKEYTVLGFCTSKVGTSSALLYDHMPGQFISCFDMDSDQKGWATH